MLYGSDTHAETAAATFSVIGLVPAAWPRSIPVPRGVSACLAVLASRPLSGARPQVLARDTRPAQTRRARLADLRIRGAGPARTTPRKLVISEA